MLTAVINFAAQRTNAIENNEERDKIECVSVRLDDHDYRQMDINEQDVLRYICGYLIRNCLKVHSCDLCIKYSKEYVDLNDTSYYCFFRAYSSTNDNLIGNLCMPNNNFIEYIKTLENLFFEKINEYILQPSIINNFIKLFKQVEFVSPCTQFPQDYLIKLFARVRLYYTKIY